MSMSFEVFPTNNYMPVSNELITLSQKYIEDFLKRKEINFKIEIRTEIRSVQNHVILKGDDLLKDEFKYEAFILNNSGQALVFYHRRNEIDEEFWREEISCNRKAKKIEHLIKKNLELGYSWSVKRTMAQSAIINLYYGFLAIAIAKLTDGFLYSDDGAWEYNCFPSKVSEFEKEYLDVSKLKDDNKKEWINNCLLKIKCSFFI